MPQVKPGAMSAPELLRWLRGKLGLIEIDAWDSIGAEQYAEAFTAARTAGHAIVGDLYSALMASWSTDKTFGDFHDRVAPILRSKGWLGLEGEALARRLDLIFYQNLQVARAVGQWERIEKNKGLMPYLVYDATLDNRVRPHHRAMHGICLPVEHPFWQTNYPPNGFRCRCRVRQLTRSMAHRHGITSESDLAARTAQVQPDDGWDHNPATLLREVQARARMGGGPMAAGAPMDLEADRRLGRAAWLEDNSRG